MARTIPALTRSDLQPKPIAHLPALAARDVELGALGVVEREPDPVWSRALHRRDLRAVDDVAAMDADEAAGRRPSSSRSEAVQR
jgi:hypothetical protein